MVFPGPNSLANLIAPATLMPLEPPKNKPSSLSKSKIILRASLSSALKDKSIGQFSKFLVIRP